MTQLGAKNHGQLLKKAREQLGLSINDVAVSTKINPRILKALEDNQRELLPAKSFTRGFIRTYAAYLKIDPKPILDGYDADGEIHPPKIDETSLTAGADAKPAGGKKQSSTLVRASVSPSSKFFLIASILFLVVLIIGIKKIVDKYAHERAVQTVSDISPGASPNPSTAMAAPPNPLSSSGAEADEDDDADDTTTATTPTNGSPQPSPSVTAAPAAIAAMKTPEPQKSLESAPPKPSDKLADKPVSPKLEEPPPKPTAKPAAKETADTLAAQPGKPQEVIIEALDNVEVTIQIDDEPSTTVKLTPESIHTIKAKSQIDLEIADGGMVNLIYNGHERGVPGVLGKPVKIKFP